MEGKTNVQQLLEYLETKKGKTYFIGVITIVTVSIMLMFAIVPAIKSITDKVAQNKVRQEYLAVLNKREDIIKGLLSEEESSLDEISFLEELLPDRRNDEYFLANINRIALNNNNVVLSSKFGNETSSKFKLKGSNDLFLKEVPITLNVQGTIYSLGEFLQQIEEFPSIVSVDNITFTNKNIRPTNGRDILLSLQVNYYYYQYVAK